MMTAAFEITRDGDKTFVQWRGPDGPVEVTTSEMDHLIAALASWRGLMEPPVPMTLPQTDQVTTYLATTDPAYWVQPDALNGDALMHLRHPCLGWLSFLLPRSESKRLSELLASIAETPPPTLGRAQ